MPENIAMNRRKYLVKNTLIFALGNFGSKFINFILVPLYTYVLTTSEYGTVDLIYTLGTILVPALTLGIAEAVMRFSLDENAEIDKIVSAGLLMVLVSTILGLLIFPIGSLWEDVRVYSKYLYGYTVALSMSKVFMSVLRGKELLLRYSIGNIINSLSIALLNILFLLKCHWGIEGYLLAYILSNVITAAFAFFAGDVFSTIKHFSVDKILLNKMLKYSIVLIPNTFMWWIMNSSDRIMVTAMVGVAVNGIYAVAYKVPTILSTITSVFNQAWSYSAIKEESSNDKAAYSNQVYNGYVAVSVGTAIGLLAIIKPFLKIYVSDEYFSAWRYTPFLLVGFVFMTLGTFVSTSYTVHKDSMGFLISGTLGALFNIIFNFLLIPTFGAMGAACATCISYVVVYLYRVINTKKYLRLDVLNPKHLIAFFILIVAALSEFLNGWYGMVLMWLEFLGVLILYKSYWLQLFKNIKTKLKKNK